MRQTILLADDSPTIQRLVSQTFADGNYDVIAVSNGEAAIKRFDEAHPDVVLADIYMPGRSGYEVCAYVKAHQSLGATPVILLVGAFDAFDEATATQAGAAASITKPFEPRALIELVQSVLANAPAREKEPAKEKEKDKESQKKPEPVEHVLKAPVEHVLKAVSEPVVHVLKPVPEPLVASVAAKQTVAAPAPSPAPVPAPKVAPPVTTKVAENDILGLSALFPVESPRLGPEIGDAEIDRIAERVMKKLSSQAVERVAWDVVPDIAEKVIRESLKKAE